MRHQIPHPEISSSSFAVTAGPSGSGTSSSSSSSTATPGPLRPPPPGSKSHSVIRTLRQKSMMASKSENQRSSFVSSALASSSLVLANLEKAHQAQMRRPDAPFNAIKNIVKGMSAVISDLRAEADKNPTPLPSSAADCSNEVESLKQRLAIVSRANHMMAIHLDLMDLQRKIEAQEHRDLEEKKSFVTAAREELFKEIVELIEAELSCSICNEILITPTVCRCGHTFCEFCIATWTKDKIDCPICRTVIFREFRKHHEIENFLNRVHLRLSEDIQQSRQTLVTERMAAMEALRATARPSPQPLPQPLIQQPPAAQQQPPPSTPERPAVYRNYRRLLRRPSPDRSDEDEDEPEDRLRARIVQQLESAITNQDQSSSGIRIRRIALQPANMVTLRSATTSTDSIDTNVHAHADAAAFVPVPSFMLQRPNNNNAMMEPPDTRLIPRPRLSARRGIFQFPLTSSHPNPRLLRFQRVRVALPPSLSASGGTGQNQNAEQVGLSATNNSSQSDSIQTAEDSMQTIRSIFSSLDANSSATTTGDASGSSSTSPTATPSAISSEFQINMRSASATSASSMSSGEGNSEGSSVVRVDFIGIGNGRRIEPSIHRVAGILRPNSSGGSILPEDLSARPQFIQVEEVENMELDNPLEDEFPEQPQQLVDYGRSRAPKIFRPFRTSDDEMVGASTSGLARTGTVIRNRQQESSLSAEHGDSIVHLEMDAIESPSGSPGSPTSTSRSQQNNVDGGNVADSTSTISTARRQTASDDDEVVFIPI